MKSEDLTALIDKYLSISWNRHREQAKNQCEQQAAAGSRLNYRARVMFGGIATLQLDDNKIHHALVLHQVHQLWDLRLQERCDKCRFLYHLALVLVELLLHVDHRQVPLDLKQLCFAFFAVLDEPRERRHH